MKKRQGFKSIWRRVWEWLDDEPGPDFTLSPGYRGLEDRVSTRGPSEKSKGDSLVNDFDKNMTRVKSTLNADESADIVVREFVLPTRRGLRGALVFAQGMVDTRTVNADILQPLLSADEGFAKRIARALTAGNVEEVFPTASVKREIYFSKLASEVLSGRVAVLLDGLAFALIASAEGYEKRAVSTSQTERTVIGPQQGFTENLMDNITLMRRLLRTPQLICRVAEVGEVSKTNVAIVYIKGVTNDELVGEVQRRISGTEASALLDSGMLEQFMDEPRFPLIPSSVMTERPDRLAAHVAEGYVGILVDNTPFALIVPATATTLLYSSEDYYIKYPWATFLRIIRLLGAGLALLLPGVYIAVVNHHLEMIPSKIIFAIAASREAVPMPAAVEIFVGEVAFDFIREAGARVPLSIGPTIGIVGAILIGEAAVRASLLSPAIVIIVAVTAISSLTLPNQDLLFPVRVLRYLFIVVAAVFGLLGVLLVSFVLLVYICSVRNYGVPFMSGLTSTESRADSLLRGPLWKMSRRPEFLRTKDETRQPFKARRWLRRIGRLGKKT